MCLISARDWTLRERIESIWLLAGSEGNAWLQYGCNLNMTSVQDISLLKKEEWPTVDVRGRWASKEERIGEVQCCVTAPRIHVCTRDYCLSGKEGPLLSAQRPGSRMSL